MKSALSYQGGKSRLAPQIVKMFPEHTCYVEPFCGACWVLFEKAPSKVEIINDLDSDLVTFWRVIQNHLPEFRRYYEWAVTSREIFNLEKRKDPTTLTDVQRACRYFYLQKLCFGGKVQGRSFGTSAVQPSRLNLMDIDDLLLAIHWRMSKVTIEHLDAIACIQKYDRPGTLFYCDPPYFETAGYNVSFEEADLIRLRDSLFAAQGKVVVSLNDHPRVRQIFDGWSFKTASLKYSIGRSAASKSKDRAEVIITNF